MIFDKILGKQNNTESNRILGDRSLIDDAGKVNIVFKGENNILYLEKGIKLLKYLNIVYEGSNSLVYLSRSRSEYHLSVEIGSDAVCFIGPYAFTNKTRRLETTVRSGDMLITGTDCMFSRGISLDTLSMDGKSHGDILIGNHVWLGQDVKVYGPSVIESGAVMGSDTVVDSAVCSGNSCWVTKNGELTKLRENTAFRKDSMRNVPSEHLDAFDHLDAETHGKLMEMSGKDSYPELAADLRKTSTADRRLKLIKKDAHGIIGHQVPVADLTAFRSDDEEEGAKADNLIIGEYDESQDNIITFNGKGNVLYIEKGAQLEKSRITFNGDDSLVYLSSSDKPYHMRTMVHYGTCAYFGKNCSLPPKGQLHVIASEAKHIIIGDGITFGKRVWIRNSDQHPVYDLSTGQRINKARSVIIGSGAEIADETLIFKGKKLNISSDDHEGAALLKLSEELDGSRSNDERLRSIAAYKTQQLKEGKKGKKETT